MIVSVHSQQCRQEYIEVFRGLKFEPDPRGIGYAFHGAGADIGGKDSFRSGTKYELGFFQNYK
jgi:hypothetical protein